jgi:hypothetical protein
MTREEHLAWAKTRALEYANRGDLVNAVASMGSDLALLVGAAPAFVAEPIGRPLAALRR